MKINRKRLRNADCEFKFNNISQNRIGFYIDDESENNLIWQNYFLNNTEYQAVDDGIGNKWNNITTGNYWSDFNYNDIYYQISGIANSTDYYPLNLVNEETEETNEEEETNIEEEEKLSNLIPYIGWGLTLGFVIFSILFVKIKKYKKAN